MYLSAVKKNFQNFIIIASLPQFKSVLKELDANVI